jgi:hypothetical protein
MKVKILSINKVLNNSEIMQSTLENAPSISDYDVLIIDPKSLFSKQYLSPTIKLLDGSYYTNMIRDGGHGKYIRALFEARQEEVTKLLQASQGVILCYLRPLQEPLIIESMNGNRFHATNYSWIPESLPVPSAGGRTISLLGNFGFTANRGTEVTFIDMKHSFSRFFRAFKDEIQFECILEMRSQLIPYARVLARNKVGEIISCEISIEGGSLIFLPTIRPSSAEKEAGVLLDCIQGILGSGFEDPPPSWIGNYEVPGETRYEKEIEKLILQIKGLDVTKKGFEVEQDKVARFKRLLYERGTRGLEPIVRETFRLFGFNVLERDTYSEDFDLYIKEEGLTIIGEIEGTDNSFVDLDKYRQLLDYTEQESDKGTKCKGILIGNAWRRTDPAERKEQFSPHAITRSQQQGFCLITTYQLFEIAKKILSGITDQELKDIRSEIISCNGILSLSEQKRDKS